MENSSMPVLTGTPKQIAWANDIRASVVREVATWGDPQSPVGVEFAPMYQARLAVLVSTCVEARWWIDHRTGNLRRLLATRAERQGTLDYGQDAWTPEGASI